MQTCVQKWGNSLALRIPKSFAEDLHLVSGGLVDVREDDGGLKIVPIRKKTLNLQTMLGRISEDNLHTETELGQEGRELL